MKMPIIYPGHPCTNMVRLISLSFYIIFFRELQLEDMFDFWKEANIGQSADIMASPENIPILENLLSEHGIHYTEMIKDVEVLHQSNLRDSLKIIKTDAQYDWNDYYSHAEINTFIDGLVSLLFLVCLYFLFTFIFTTLVVKKK